MSSSTNLLMTRQQLEALTGTKQPARMATWLESRHWVYEPPARRGEIPRVSLAYFEARMSGQSSIDSSRRRSAPRLDFFAA